MMLTREEVLQIAKLASLELADDEVEKFRQQLSDVLELFKKIDDVDLKNIEETSQVTGLENVMREDEVLPSECSREELLENAPRKNENSIIVPKVIEDKQ
jgi:aspartyl-tRNA(Asn)/glutamyl-tRNA(Gln) amidotransferase subunit C